MVAGDGGCLVWPASIGMHRAKRYLLTGDLLSAEDAFRFGLVTDLVDTADECLPAARKIAEDYSASGIVAAIRGAQADAIRYPEFVRQSPEAGVIGYWAFLTGKKVVYFGRKGEMHVAEFPKV